MGLWSWMKANFILLHVLIGFIFVVSGLLINGLMLLANIFIWPFNKTLYRKIVNNLAYTHWCQFTFLGQWWSGSDCTLHTEDPETVKLIGQEHTIVIMNHKYDIDWMMSWILAERLDMLGGTKIYGKSSLKWVPLLGWAWMFTESIFLKRDWDKDKEIIARDLAYIRDYPDGYWVTLLLFCEGTRFTVEKHELSMEIAKQKGLPILKHHLLPRTKGFVHSMYGLQGKIPAILDLTVAFTKDSAPPNMMSIIQGKKCRAEMFVRRIPLEQVPLETEEACAQWLHKLYKEKDDIYDNFVQNGRFTIGKKFEIPRRPNDLFIWCCWALVLGVPFIYYTAEVFLSGSLTLLLSAAFVMFVGYAIVRYMISVSEIKTTSSNYGNNKKTT